MGILTVHPAVGPLFLCDHTHPIMWRMFLPFISSGQLPFLTHGTLTLAGLAPILAYAMKFEQAVNPDAHLSNLEKAQLAARIAHIESEGGDLLVRLSLVFSLDCYLIANGCCAGTFILFRRCQLVPKCSTGDLCCSSNSTAVLCPRKATELV